jgi:hypothetical protein
VDACTLQIVARKLEAKGSPRGRGGKNYERIYVWQEEKSMKMCCKYGFGRLSREQGGKQ